MRIPYILFIVSSLQATASYASDVDLQFIKSVDVSLYKQIQQIARCKALKKSAEQCSKDISKSNTLTSKAIVQAAPPPSPSAPSKWWQASAYALGQPQSKWQHATDVSVSLSKLSGNIDGDQNSISINYFSRYDAWTNNLSLAYAKDKVTQSNELVSDRSFRLFNYGGKYDFNRTWFGQLGWIKEQDDSLSLDDKTVGYVGGGAYLTYSDNHKLHLVMALGNQNDKVSDANRALTGLNEFDYDVAYAYQEYNWQIADNLMFNQSLSIIYGFDELAEFADASTSVCKETLTPTATYCIVGHNKTNQYQLTLGLEYKLSKMVSLSYSFNFDHDTQPFLDDDASNSSQSLAVTARFQ